MSQSIQNNIKKQALSKLQAQKAAGKGQVQKLDPNFPDIEKLKPLSLDVAKELGQNLKKEFTAHKDKGLTNLGKILSKPAIQMKDIVQARSILDSSSASKLSSNHLHTAHAVLDAHEEKVNSTQNPIRNLVSMFKETSSKTMGIRSAELKKLDATLASICENEKDIKKAAFKALEALNDFSVKKPNERTEAVKLLKQGLGNLLEKLSPKTLVETAQDKVKNLSRQLEKLSSKEAQALKKDSATLLKASISTKTQLNVVNSWISQAEKIIEASKTKATGSTQKIEASYSELSLAQKHAKSIATFTKALGSANNSTITLSKDNEVALAKLFENKQLSTNEKTIQNIGQVLAKTGLLLDSKNPNASIETVATSYIKSDLSDLAKVTNTFNLGSSTSVNDLKTLITFTQELQFCAIEAQHALNEPHLTQTNATQTQLSATLMQLQKQLLSHEKQTVIHLKTTELTTLATKELDTVSKNLSPFLDSTQINAFKKLVQNLHHFATNINVDKQDAYSKVTPENKEKVATLYEKAVLKTQDKTYDSQFIKKFGSLLSSFVKSNSDKQLNAWVNDIATGDYRSLTAVQDHLNVVDTKNISHSTQLDETVLKISLSTAKNETELKTRFIEHGLKSAKQAFRSAWLGEPGTFNDIAFDSQTIKAFVNAKDMDAIKLKEANLLFGHVIILEHELSELRTPSESPEKSKEKLLKKLNEAGIKLDSETVKKSAEQGFKNTSDVESAVTFITEISKKLANNDAIKGLLTRCIGENPKFFAKKTVDKTIAKTTNMVGISEHQRSQLSEAFNERISGLREFIQSDKALEANKAFAKANELANEIEDIEDQMEQLGSTKDLEKLEATATNALKVKEGGRSNQILRNVFELSAESASIKNVDNPEVKTPLGPTSLDPIVDLKPLLSDLINQKSELAATAKFSGRYTGYKLAAVDQNGTPLNWSLNNGKLEPKHAQSVHYLGLFENVFNAKTGQTETVFQGFIDPSKNKKELEAYQNKLNHLLGTDLKTDKNLTVKDMDGSSTWKEEIAKYNPKTYKREALGSKTTWTPDKVATLFVNTTDSIVRESLASKQDIVSAKTELTELSKSLENKKTELSKSLKKTNIDSTLNTIRLAVRAALCEALVKSSQNLDSFVKDTLSGSNQTTLAKHLAQFGLSEDSFSKYGLDSDTLKTMVSREARKIKGIETIKKWSEAKAIKLEASQEKLLKDIEALKNNSEIRAEMKEESLALSNATDMVGKLKTNDTSSYFDVTFGTLLSYKTPDFVRTAMQGLTGGSVDVGLTAEAKNINLFRMKKEEVTTPKGKETIFAAYISREMAGKLGVDVRTLGGAAEVGIDGGLGKNWGFKLEFDTAEKASLFVASMMTGSFDAVALGDAKTVLNSKGSSGSISGHASLGFDLPLPSFDITPPLSTESQSTPDKLANQGLKLSIAITRDTTTTNRENVNQKISERTKETTLSLTATQPILNAILDLARTFVKNKDTADTVEKTGRAAISIKTGSTTIVEQHKNVITSAKVIKGAKVDINLGPVSGPVLGLGMVLPKEMADLEKTNKAKFDEISNLVKNAKSGSGFFVEYALPDDVLFTISQLQDPNSSTYNLKEAEKLLANESLYKPSKLICLTEKTDRQDDQSYTAMGIAALTGFSYSTLQQAGFGVAKSIDISELSVTITV